MTSLFISSFFDVSESEVNPDILKLLTILLYFTPQTKHFHIAFI